MPEINWYPGHMAKSRRMLEEQMRGIDAVIELCDARAPRATRNPMLSAVCKGRARVLVLNKADLANDAATKAWMDFYRAQGMFAVRFTATGGKTREILSFIQEATKEAVERMRARGANKTVRLMVIGVPNVGKSTLINRLRGGAVVKTADRPGVTRTRQWVKVGPYLEMLDTPGMLWPRLDDQRAATRLAYIGTIRDAVYDQYELCASLLTDLMDVMPAQTAERYRIKDPSVRGYALLEEVCRGRGFLMRGGVYDLDRACAVILDEFREGRVGKLTLEEPPETGEAAQDAQTL